MSGIHVSYVFNACLLNIFCGHCPSIGDASMDCTMAFAAERNEIVRLIISAFTAGNDVMNLQILRGIAERAAITVSAIDGFAERGIDGS